MTVDGVVVVVRRSQVWVHRPLAPWRQHTCTPAGNAPEAISRPEPETYLVAAGLV